VSPFLHTLVRRGANDAKAIINEEGSILAGPSQHYLTCHIGKIFSVSIEKNIIFRSVLDASFKNHNFGSKIWYFGAINREEANDLLTMAPIGTFLLRYSENMGGYMLTVK
jgi:hypothetical protein